MRCALSLEIKVMTLGFELWPTAVLCTSSSGRIFEVFEIYRFAFEEGSSPVTNWTLSQLRTYRHVHESCQAFFYGASFYDLDRNSACLLDVFLRVGYFFVVYLASTDSISIFPLFFCPFARIVSYLSPETSTAAPRATSSAENIHLSVMNDINWKRGVCIIDSKSCYVRFR